MIIWGVCAGGRGEKLREIALPWIEKAAAAEDLIEIRFGDRGICTAYNELVEMARSRSNVEALVLLHDDAELVDSDARNKILSAARRPGVGVLGVIGGSDLRDGRWWRAREQAGYAIDSRGVHDLGDRDRAVDIVDGVCLVLTREALRRLTFDPRTFPGFHGYDADICLASRAAGLENRVLPLDLVHRDKGFLSHPDTFHEAQRAIRRKWPAYVHDDPYLRRAMKPDGPWRRRVQSALGRWPPSRRLP